MLKIKLLIPEGASLGFGTWSHRLKAGVGVTP